SWSDGKFDDKAMEELIPYIEEQSVISVMSICNYLCSEVEKLCKKENDALVSPPTGEEMRAGIERFAEFGSMNSIDAIAMGDITKYEAVQMMDYGTWFTKMKMNKVKSEYQKKLQTIL